MDPFTSCHLNFSAKKKLVKNFRTFLASMEISAKVHLGVQEFQSDSTRATSQRSYTMLGVSTMSWMLEADS